MQETDRVRVIGIDEAGLGPYLGPLALGGVAFDVPADWLGKDWWEALAPTVARDIAAPFPIDDSKRIFPAKGGRDAAARTFSGVLGSLPAGVGRTFNCLESMLELLAAGCLDEAQERTLVRGVSGVRGCRRCRPRRRLEVVRREHRRCCIRSRFPTAVQSSALET